jgi:RNA polymerase sigma-70 factor (ECF subfamily)
MTSEHVGAISPPAAREAEFETLFLQHYSRVYGVLYRLVGNKPEAEDLALETFWKLWDQPPPRGANLGGWLYRVASRLGFNALRAAHRRLRHEGEAGFIILERQAAPDPQREAEHGEERQQARAALGRLSERDAQLLILRYSGLSYKEIAAALGIAPGSVGTLLVRAEREFEKQFVAGDHPAAAGGPDAPQR